MPTFLGQKLRFSTWIVGSPTGCSQFSVSQTTLAMMIRRTIWLCQLSRHLGTTTFSRTISWPLVPIEWPGSSPISGAGSFLKISITFLTKARTFGRKSSREQTAKWAWTAEVAFQSYLSTQCMHTTNHSCNLRVADVRFPAISLVPMRQLTVAILKARPDTSKWNGWRSSWRWCETSEWRLSWSGMFHQHGPVPSKVGMKRKHSRNVTSFQTFKFLTWLQLLEKVCSVVETVPRRHCWLYLRVCHFCFFN